MRSCSSRDCEVARALLKPVSQGKDKKKEVDFFTLHTCMRFHNFINNISDLNIYIYIYILKDLITFALFFLAKKVLLRRWRSVPKDRVWLPFEELTKEDTLTVFDYHMFRRQLKAFALR